MLPRNPSESGIMAVAFIGTRVVVSGIVVFVIAMPRDRDNGGGDGN